VKPARENLVYCIARGRNTCDSIDYNKWILQTTTIRLFNKKGSFVRSYQFFMSTQIITSEDVMNTVIKPISLLERYREDTIFTHNPANAKGVSNYDIVDKSYLSLLHHRKVVRISLLRMTCVTHKGVPFKDSFK
jgi:hypothetical protein